LEYHCSREPSENARNLLLEVFRFTHFLPYQKQIIEAVIDGKDLLAVLPTGSGKSLCFQIPALLRNGITVVISPLIALMKDQIDRLRRHSLPVEYINSSLSAAETKSILDSIRSGNVRLVYVAPERLRDPSFLNTLCSLRHEEAPLWVVDEAHCITEWGHDFRTDYLFIPDAIELVAPGSQLIMFTATATPLVREDILRQMRRPSALVICGRFDRPNLYLGCRSARTKNEKLRALAQLLRKPGSGIIYTATRKQCETVHRFLQESFFRADFYHAGRTGNVRREVHENFMAGNLDIVVATNAFGMGLNKPDIRFIIHYAHPGSIDAYYQEIGRGGRDGVRCDCILLFSPFDRRIQERFIANATPDAQPISDCFAQLQVTRNFNDVLVGRRFYERHHIELFELEKAGVIERSSTPCGVASIYLSRQFEKAFAHCSEEEKSILRALDDCFGISRTGHAEHVDLHEFCLNVMPHLAPFALEQRLFDMMRNGILIYRSASQDIRYMMRVHSLSQGTIRTIEHSVMERRRFKMQRLNVMAAYGNWDKCLRAYLLEALSDPAVSDGCGFCDNC
jgi:RecQ family ATP-dependent DNA helicase